MYSVTPKCKGGNNSNCSLQWRRLNGIEVDIPDTPLPEGVELPVGFGKSDTGDVMCTTCKHSWVYTVLFGNISFVERYKPDQQIAAENGHEHGDDCGCGV